MFPEDDHGRFRCFSCGSGYDTVAEQVMPPPAPIPQVDTTGMTDQEKARIPPINRLHSTPTAAEAAFFAVMSKGPNAMGTPEYVDAVKAVEEERG